MVATQQELIVDEARGVALAEPPEQPTANDLRHLMMTLPVDTQNAFLTQYKASRDNFRTWLMKQLVEGVHYGIVPGCEPKTKLVNGVTHYGVWNKKKSQFDFYPPEQWTPKPSLYAAGADFICDIMGVRDEYETDAVGWQQMGSKPGTAVVKCKLKSRANGELVGESLGAYHNQYDANNALKMAGKCAKVGAVINAYDLRDLFTQEEPTATPNENPEANPAAAQEATRDKRGDVTAAQLKHVTGQWQAKNKDPDGNVDRMREAFREWAKQVCERDFDAGKISQWTVSDYLACCDALKIPTLEELEGNR